MADPASKKMPISIHIFHCLLLLIGIEAKRHTDLIIIGGTGDLARKYLWKSSLELFAKHGNENDTLSMYAGSRLPKGEGTLVLNQIMEKIQCATDDSLCQKKRPDFLKNFHYVQLRSPENYTAFCQQLSKLSKEREITTEEQIFYLSLPSSAYENAAKNIHANCRYAPSQSIKVVLEKPFGRSKVTASKQADMIETYFTDSEVYRVDHYLAKSVTKQILNFRHSNKEVLEKMLNRQFVDRIEVVMKETIGVKDRIEFYDQTGVIRDVMQNHLTELLTLVTMEMPDNIDDSRQINEMKMNCLRTFKPLSLRHILTGQYSTYIEEALAEKENISQSVNTPTFSAVLLQNSNYKWKGVPMILLSGKHMDERSSYIRILFREQNFCVSGCVGGNSSQSKYPRQIIFQIGHGDVPSAGILVSKSLFKPTWPSGMKELSMTAKDMLIHGQSPGDFHYGVPVDDVPAYDRVLEDLYLNNRETFVTTHRMLVLWEIWDNVLHELTNIPPRLYVPGKPHNLNFKVENSSLIFLNEDHNHKESNKLLYSIPNTFRNGSLFCNRLNEVIRSLAQHIIKIAQETIKQGNDFHIAVSGGRTPVALFDELVHNLPEFPWQHTHVWQVDERCVSQKHENSNFLSVYEHLLKHVDIPYFNIHPMPVNFAGQICNRDDKGDNLYENSIKHLIREQKFDVVLLGLGKDGHIASLFPNSKYLDPKRDKLVAYTTSQNIGNTDRMSLLLPVINKSKNIIFLVTGREKYDIMKSIKDRNIPDKSSPVTFVGSDSSQIFWYVDLDAWTGLVQPNFSHKGH